MAQAATYDGDATDEKTSQTLDEMLATLEQVPLTGIVTWTQDIEPMLEQVPQQIGTLMTDFHTTRGNLGEISRVMEVESYENAALSQWIALPVFSPAQLPRTIYKLNSVPEVLTLLQAAIDIEFATLPLYLSGVYSLNDKTPGGQALSDMMIGRYGGVIFQEMKHFGLAANIFNAIAGASRPGPVVTAPVYPITKLPGNILPHVQLDVGPATRERVFSEYMGVEQPVFADAGYDYKPLQEQDVTIPNAGETSFTVTYTKVPAGSPEGIGETIAKFYLSIQNWIEANPSQVTNNRQFSDQTVGVFETPNATEALKAISEIVTEGEGTVSSPNDGGSQLSHYYKFLSAFVDQTVTRFDYPPTETGDKVVYTFHTTGVPLQYSNADVNQGLQSEVDANFTTAYTSMVNGFAAQLSNANPDMSGPIGAMYSMGADYRAAVGNGIAPKWVTN